MKDKTIVLKVIIVLLIFFLPITIIGTVYKILNPHLRGNPKGEFKYNGALRFYSEDKEFLSKYECVTEICDYATPIIDDNEYGINYYQDGTKDNNENINGLYAFINDGDKVILYNIKNGSTLNEYKSIKNYQTNLSNNEFIIKTKDGLWGVLAFGSVLSNIIPFEYDFIGLINNYDDENNILNTDNFITLKNGKWQILNHDNSIVSKAVNYPIVNYNKTYIICNEEGRFHIFDYRGTEYLTYSVITDYYLIDKYIALTVNKVMYIYDDLNNNYLANINLNEITGEISFELENDNLLVKNGENIISEINNSN